MTKIENQKSKDKIITKRLFTNCFVHTNNTLYIALLKLRRYKDFITGKKLDRKQKLERLCGLIINKRIMRLRKAYWPLFSNKEVKKLEWDICLSITRNFTNRIFTYYMECERQCFHNLLLNKKDLVALEQSNNKLKNAMLLNLVKKLEIKKRMAYTDMRKKARELTILTERSDLMKKN